MKMRDSKKKKISRRTFLKKGKKFVYLTPAIYTFFTDSREALAQGRAARAAAANARAAAADARAERAAAALAARVEQLEALAAQGNQQAAQALQRLRERLVSPP